MNALALYGRYCAASVRAQLAYPASLGMMMLGQFLITGVEFLAIWAMFHRFGHVGQWSIGEVALFYGLVSVSFATSDMITRGFDIFGSVYVKGGGFDRLLLRPRSLALQVMGHELRLTRVGRYAQGFIVFGVGVWITHFQFTSAAMGILAFAVAGGTALFAGLLVLQATLSFWTVESLEAINIFTYGGEAAGEYPLNVYAGWFRDFLMWGVPIGCVTYLPMLAAMGRADPLGTPAWLGPVAPLAGFLFLSVALFIWRFGVSRYTSTGS
jgi:ABC-2 type transport system permease protein